VPLEEMTENRQVRACPELPPAAGTGHGAPAMTPHPTSTQLAAAAAVHGLAALVRWDRAPATALGLDRLPLPCALAVLTERPHLLRWPPAGSAALPKIAA
jgi:hypothetical protein